MRHSSERMHCMLQQPLGTKVHAAGYVTHLLHKGGHLLGPDCAAAVLKQRLVRPAKAQHVQSKDSGILGKRRDVVSPA